MRKIALVRKSLVLLASLAALSVLGGPSTASATGTSISGPSLSILVVQGTWSDSGVTLAEDVQGTLYHTSILISDQSLLREGWLIKVGNEYMLIEELIEGGYGNPDTMVVQRPMNGTVADPHSLGTMIKAHTLTAYIYANEVTDSWGLGAFTVAITLPPELEYVKLTPQTTWLASTGRDPWCDGPFQNGDTWRVNCWTIGNPDDGRYPLGPQGSGVIAKVVLLPPQDLGLNIVNLGTSMLANTVSTTIPATLQNFSIRVIGCPDTDLNGKVDSGDLLLIAKNFGDRGEDSGATLVNEVDASQTEMEISDQGSLVLDDTIGVGAEQMTVATLEEGPPDAMTVVRAVNNTRAKSHSAGTQIFRATYDGNRDGKKGYTGTRDVTHEGVLDSGDSLIIARTMVSYCPTP